MAYSDKVIRFMKTSFGFGGRAAAVSVRKFNA